MKKFKTSLRVYLTFTILLGLIYPLTMTFIAQMLSPDKANGSLIVKDNRLLGSRLIGQKFTQAKYFHSRPSTVDYNATSSGASNLGPASRKLMDAVTERIKNSRVEYNLSPDERIPADMALSSASGLDPHITMENALIQAKRVSKTRGVSEEEIIEMIKNNIDKDFIGIWGEKGINVLKLNMALDTLIQK